MNKKLWIGLLLLCGVLAAGQYATLKDGTVIILKDDGTWEKVTPVDKPPKPAVDAESVRKSRVIETNEKPEEPAKEAAADPRAAEILQRLAGSWRSLDGGRELIVDGATARWIEGRTRRSGPVAVEKISLDGGTFTLRIGSAERVGIFSFGGLRRTFRLESDGGELVDLSGSMPVILKKVR